MLNDLPKTKDEYWEGAETYAHTPVVIPLCAHSRETWMEATNYIQEDGVALCTECPWGTPLAGNLRVIDGKIIDLRSL